MRILFLNVLILLLMASSGCNNPSGGSVIGRGNAPFLQAPAAFSFSQIRSVDGNVVLRWQASKRAAQYKVFMGTSNTDVTTPVPSCTGLVTTCSITGLDPNTLYYFDVESSNDAGKKKITALGIALSVSSFDITSSSVGNGTITLSWASSNNAANYNIVYGYSSGSYPNTVTNVTSPYTLTGLSNGQRHYVRVIATNTSNGYAMSDSEINELPLGPPLAPTGLSLVPAPGQMTFSWNLVSGSSTYKVYRGTSSGSLSLLTTIASNSYTDTTTTDGTTYYYAVVANNGLFDSPQSSEVYARSISNFNLTSVSTGGSPNQLVVTWPAVTGASTYNIRYGTNPASLTSTVSNVTSPATITGLTGGSTYYFKVTALNAIGSGTSLNSLNQLSGTALSAVSAPANLTATSSPSQVILNWNASSGATSYEVLRGTTSGSYTSLQSGIIGTTFTDSTAVNGVAYFYVVRAFNGLFSGYSTEVTTKPIASFNITSANSTSSTSITLNWAGAAGADLYDIRYGTASGSYPSTVASVTSPYIITGLTSNTTYYFVIRGKNAVGTGTSIQTAQVSARTSTAAPTGLVASTTPGQVALDWANTPGALTYNVYRGTTSGTYSLLASGLTTSDYNDATVTDGTTYYYAVSSDNGSESAKSAEVQARSISTLALTSLTIASPTSLTITWPATNGAATYDVKYGTSSGVYTTTLTNKTSPFTITGLASGTVYYAIVVAKNAVGTGSSVNSNQLSQQTPVGPPVGVLATVGNSQITISWNTMAGASSYKVFRGTTSGSYTEIANGIVGLNYVDTTVSDGTQYYYVVKSYNGADSADSAEVTGKSIAAYALTSVTALSPTSIQITFPATSGGDIQEVRYGTATGSYTTTLTPAVSPKTITGLTANTTYFVVGRSRNVVGSGASAQTAEMSIKTPTVAPASLAAASTPGQVALTWGAVTGAASYKIYRGTSSGTYTEIANSVATNSYTDTTVTNGTTYFYAVIAFNGSDSAYSNEVSTQPIAAHTISSVTSPSSTSIQVTFGAVTGATAYDVRWGTTSGTYTGQALNVTSPYTITALTSNTTYYIVVRAKNSVGAGTNTNSTETSIKTSTAAPTGLVATAAPGQVSLDWANTTGASSYKVFRGTSSGSYTEIANNVVTSAYLDTTVTDGTTYYYAVTSYNGSDSAYSNEISVQPIGTFNLTAATAASSSSLSLTWSAATGATSYDVRYGTSTGVYLSTVTNATSPYTLTGLSAGTTYFVSIRAKNAIGAGTNLDSNERNATTASAAPSGLTASSVTGQINLSWTASAGATSYNIYRGTVSGSYSQIASGVTGTTYSDTTVTDGIQYYYAVRSFNGAESANSAEATSTSIAAFSIASTTAPSPSTIQVTWSATSGASLYDVRYGTVSGTYTTISSVTSPYTITGLASGTNYFVVVRARNTIGAGGVAQTPEVSQITPIGPPTSLVATATPSAINLSWTAAGGATNYKVYRGTSSGSYSQIASGVTGTTYSDTSAVNGTTYYYAVTSFNGADSAYSNEATSRSISSFSISSVTSPTATSLQVTWGAATGAATYDVRYGTTSGSYTTTLTGVTSPYTITGLTANTTYYVLVRANNAVGAGAIVNSAEVAQKSATAAPVGLTASASSGQVGLNWTATTGATDYKVYRGTTSGSLSLLASAVASNAYLDTTVANGTTYYYAVVSNNGSDSAQSTEVSVRPISSFSLSAATAASSTSIDLTWGTATGAATYDVRYGTSSGVYLGTVTNVTSPYTLTGLSANTQYFIAIRANNSVGAGTTLNSNERNAVTATAAPTSLAATATTGKIDLSWVAASGAASYRIYRGTTSGSYTQIASGVTSTSYSDTTVVNGTQYFYSVRSYNGIESGDSNEATGQSIASFSIASTTAPTTSTIQVTWSNTAGATLYDVRYGTSTGSYSTTVSGVSSPYTITGLTGGTNYYIVVRARNVIGSGSNAQTAEVTQVTPLAAPTGLVASATPGTVSLNWTSVAGASSYKVYRGTTSGSLTEIANSVATNSYTDATASNGVTYYYAVSAYNGADSASSAEVSARPIASFTITATVLTANSIQISWTNPAGGATYDVKYGTTTGSYTTTLASQTSPVTVTGLSPGSTYFFVVDAKNAVGSGTIRTSAEVGATTAFGAPNGLAATATPGNVALTWNAVSGATSYKVYRGTTSGSYTSLATGVATNSYTDSTAVNGTTYFYVVKASNGADSADSNEATIRAINTFTFTSATTASASSMDLVWTAATGAATYDVRYGTSTGSYTSTVAGVTSPYTLTGLTAGTTYYVSIRAKNAVGSGTNVDSSELNAKTSPSAPSSLTAAATTGQVALSWSAGSGSTTYNIYRGTTSGSYSSLASGVAGTTYTDSTAANGTQYFYVVRGYNGTESVNSNETTALPVAGFSISSTSAPTTSTVQVTWPAVSGATLYDVRYGTSTGSYSTTVSSVTSPYTITGLTGGTTYYIVVSARNTVGSGSQSQSAEVSQITPLGAPSGLTASSTPGSVLLNWSTVTGATSYKIFRGTTSGSYSSLATGVGTNSYTDSTAANGTTYFYVVKAYNGADSADSNEATTKPIANFSIASTSSPSSTSALVTWSAPAGGATYDIKYGTATGSYSTTVAGVTSPYTITGLSANTNYYIVVVAKNAIGSGTSVTSSESVQKTASAAPTGLALVASPGSVAMSWTAVSGATDYKIYRGTVSGSLSLLASGNVPASYTDSTAANGTTYYYAIVANNGSDSAQSAEASIQPISTFTFTSATTASSSSMSLVWTAATGAASYDVRYGTATGTYTSGTITGATSPYTLTGLTAGTTYYVSIRAKNAVGTGTQVDSSERNAKTSPGAPSSLAATATTSQIALSWSAGSGSTNYNIYRGTTSGSYTSLATAVSGTTYNDTSVVNGTQYFYVVRGNNGTESADSNEATAQSIASFSISSTTAPTPTTITVNWPATAGASAYDVRYGTATGSYATTVSGVTSPYTITGLTSGTNYYIVVRARNTVGTGSSATTVEVSQITPLSAPTGLAATSIPNRITLNWTSVGGATSYNIYRGTSSGSYTSLATGVATNSYADNTVANGLQYYYVVTAYNGAESANSNEATSKSIANFSISSITSPTSTSLVVTWGAVLGGDTFDIKYGTATGSYSTTITGVTSPYTITGLSPATTYYVVVKANNAVGSGSTLNSSESSKTTAPGAPTGLVSSATPGNVGLNWTAVSGATNYNVYRGTSSGGETLLASAVATNAYMDTTAVDGTTYFYTVKANNGTLSADSNEVTIQSISSFSLTAATAASASSINLTWGSATGAATYDVQYGTSPGVYLGTVPGVTSPYTLTGLTSGTLYYIRIQAKNAVGVGTTYNSNEMNAKTAVGAPTGLAAVATPGNVQLSWSAVTGATNYNVYRSTTAGGPYTQVGSGVTSPFNNNTVSNGTTYYYVVRSYNGIESVNSTEVSVQPISTFSLTAATAASSSTINLTWGSATGATSYDVKYGTSSGSYTSGTVTNVTSPYTLTGLTASQTYYIIIQAKNAVGSGTSQNSNELNAKTATAAPTSLAATATTGQVNLTWTAAAGATNYNLYRSTTSGGPYSLIYTNIPGTSQTDTNAIVNGTTYYYVVRANNGIESSNSNEATAAPIGSFSISAVTALSTSTIQVTFGAASGATSYDVKYGTTTGLYGTTITGVTSPYTISGLTANTNYFIIVQAKNAVGSGTSTNTAEVSQVTPVAPPTGLTATGGTSQVILNWTAASGATSYKVLRGTVSGTYSVLATGITGTTYTDSTAANGTTYYYVLKSFNGADSANSSEVSKQPVATPSISTITGPSSTSLQVSWSAVSGAASYDLKYGTVSGTYTTTLTGVTSPYTITGLAIGTNYYVQLVAKNAVGGGTTILSTESSGATNSPPVLSAIADQSMESDTVLPVNFTLSDANNLVSCTTSMTASSANTTLIPNANIVFSGSVPNCTATITPAVSQTGTATITLTATDGITPVSTSFILTVTPCTVASIVWETQPTGMAAGSLFGTAPKVSLRKANNSLCTTNLTPVELSVSIDNSIQQDADITGTSTVVPSAGYATFSAARMQRAGTGYTIIASQDTIDSVDSNTFNVTALAASKIAWEEEPATSPTSATMVPSPIVRVTDTYGNYLTPNGVSITVSLQDNNEGATLGGTVTKNTSSGQSTYSNLTINKAGSYYLRATNATYGTVDSPYFDVINIIPQDTRSTIELLQGPLAHASGNVNYKRGYMMLGTNFVDGTTTWTWKVVATNTSTSSGVIRLRRGNNSVASVTVPASTTTPTLYSVAFTPGTTSGTFQLRGEGTNLNMFSSRVVIKQTGAGKTLVNVPLSSIDTAAATPYVQSTSTTLSNPSDINFPAYDWDNSKIARIDSILLHMAYQGTGGSSCVALYNKDTGTIIGAEICGTSTTENFITTTIAPSAMPAAAKIEARVRTSAAASPIRVFKVGLLVRLVNITNMVAIQQVAKSKAALTATQFFDNQRPTSYVNDYTGATVNEYVNCRVKANTAGSGTFTYYSHGTNVSGTTSPSAISASNIIFSNQSSFTTLEAGPIATTAGNNHFMGYTHSSGSFALSHCLLETEATYP